MLTRIAATALMSGALGAVAFGLSSPVALADNDRHGGCGPFGCDTFQGPPGQNPFGPPGQVKKDPYLGPFPNPVYGVPPGHWDDVVPWGPRP